MTIKEAVRSEPRITSHSLGRVTKVRLQRMAATSLVPWWLVNFGAAGTATLLTVLWPGRIPVLAPLLQLADRSYGTFAAGFLIFATLLPGSWWGNGADRTAASPAARLYRLGAAVSAAWLAAAAAHMVAHYWAEAGVHSDLRGFGDYAASSWEGRSLALETLLVAVVAVIAPWGAGRRVGGLIAGGLAVAALTTSSLAHAQTLTLPGRWLLVTHVVAATVWAGGLVGLLVVARDLAPGSPDLLDLVRRFSVIAFDAVLVVAVTGVAMALNKPEAFSWVAYLTTRWGTLLAAKTVALGALAAVGALHRAVSLKRLARGDARFLVHLGLGEIALMGLTFGLAVSLSAR